MKEKLEQFRQLLDVMDVVEDMDHVFTINNTEDETNDNSDEENTIINRISSKAKG